MNVYPVVSLKSASNTPMCKYVEISANRSEARLILQTSRIRREFRVDQTNVKQSAN